MALFIPGRIIHINRGKPQTKYAMSNTNIVYHKIIIWKFGGVIIFTVSEKTKLS